MSLLLRRHVIPVRFHFSNMNFINTLDLIFFFSVRCDALSHEYFLSLLIFIPFFLYVPIRLNDFLFSVISLITFSLFRSWLPISTPSSVSGSCSSVKTLVLVFFLIAAVVALF